MGGTHEFTENELNAQVLIYVDGSFYPRDEAKVSVFDSAFLVGDGIWESFRLHNGSLAFVRQHLARLKANIKALDYKPRMSPEAMIEEVRKTVRMNKMDSDSVHIRMMLTRGRKKSPSQDPRTNIHGETLVIIPEYKAPSRTEAEGVRLFTVHVHRSSPDILDPKLHVHSKLNCILACIQGTKAGVDEALMLDPAGFVSTCNSTNFFIVRENEVWTSSGSYCLNGITRGNIIQICKKAGIPVFEKNFSLYDVYSADEAFVTGTFGGVGFVSEVDGRLIGTGSPGPMVSRLRELYTKLLDEECPPAPSIRTEH